MQTKLKGLVLNRRNIGENDRIITILTAEHGIIEASARNVKSARSGISASCERLAYSEFCLFLGKSGYYINSAEGIDTFYNLRLDISKVSLAGYFCELTTYLSPASDDAGEYLRFFLNTLFLLQENKVESDKLKSIFELHALSITGFMPNLVCCDSCATYEADDMLILPENGIIICEKCFMTSKKNKDNTIKFELPTAVLAAMRHIIFSPLEKMFFFSLNQDAAKQLGFIAEQYVQLHTQGAFKSLDIYKSLNHS